MEGPRAGRVTDDPVGGAFGVPEPRRVVGDTVGAAVGDESLAIGPADIAESVLAARRAAVREGGRAAGVEVAHRGRPAHRAKRVTERERLGQALVDTERAELGRVAATDRRHLVGGQVEAAECRGRVGLELATEGSVADRPLDDCAELLAGHCTPLSSPSCCGSICASPVRPATPPGTPGACS